MLRRKWLGGLGAALAAGVMAGAFLAGSPVQAADPEALGIQNAWAGEVVSLSLLEAVEKSTSKGTSLASELSTTPLVKTAGGTPLVEVIYESGTAKSAKSLSIKGAKLISLSEKYDRATMAISSSDAILELAQTPGVKMVMPCYAPVTNAGKVDSKASKAMWVDTARDNYLVNGVPLSGTGQKVGVISDSFAITSGVRDSDTTPAAGIAGTLKNARNQDSGDLPSSLDILADASIYDGPSDEGAGMAELVHDIAPGAGIAFHTAYPDQAAFAEGITRLREEAGCSVVVDDIIYFAEPVYQDGIIAQSAAECVAAGVPYFSAAGNFANSAIREQFNDFNPAIDDKENPPNGNDFHRWSANGKKFLPVTLPAYSTVQMILQWNQPFKSLPGGKGSQIDMDLLCYAREALYSGSLFAYSRDLQGNTGDPDGDPFEVVGLINYSAGPATFYLAIDHWAGYQETIPQDSSARLEFTLIFLGDVSFPGYTGDSSYYGGSPMWGHCIAPGAVAVGAVPYYESPNFLPTGETSQLCEPEYFSSRGGYLSVFFDVNGNAKKRTTFEPDIAAVDGNNTTFFGGGTVDLAGYDNEPDQYPNFFGTSAAAPNAAAVAALMLQMDPTLSPAEITQLMQDTAFDVAGGRAAPGRDDITGAGLIDGDVLFAQLAKQVGIEPLTNPTPTPAPKSPILYTFNTDPVQWDYVGVPSAFTEPFVGYDSGSLVLKSHNNTNTFGMLRSPAMTTGSWQMRGDVPMAPSLTAGINPADYLFRAAFSVKSDRPTTDTARTPTFRLRESTENFEESNLVVVNSVRTPNVVPVTSAKTYYMYFRLPNGQDRFRLYTELLNTGGTDAPDGGILLDQVRVDILSVADLSGTEVDLGLDFSNNSNFWTVPALDIPSFGIAEAGLDDRGIRLGPAILDGTSPAAWFSYWSSPESINDPDHQDEIIALTSSRLYRASWTVESTATSQAQAEQLPAMRFRMNDATLNYSVYQNIESVSGSPNLPMSSRPKVYEMWFTGRPEIENSDALFAFDYLLVPGAGNSATAAVILKSLVLESYDVPD